MTGFEVSYLGALIAGILSFLSPCVLPLVPPYLCFLAGVTVDQITDDTGAQKGLFRKVFVSALFFVLGFSTIFISLGATASTIGGFITEHIELLSQIAGVTIAILGLHFIGVFKIPFLYRDTRFHTKVGAGGIIGAYVIGLAFAFGWTPCVGPVLAAILFVAGSESSILYGVSLLTVYSAGLGIPFLLAALAVRPFMTFMRNFRPYLVIVERIMGVLLIITGILFLTGTFSQLSFLLLQWIPALGSIG